VRLTVVDLATGESWSVRTNSFGYYTADQLPVNHLYNVSVNESKRLTFTPDNHTVSLVGDLQGLDFMASDR
jgi:hypothetical protein